MEVFNAICLRDETFTDGDKQLDLKRGEEYTVSHEKDGERMVFSRYWAWVPSNLFGGIEPLALRKGYREGSGHG